MNLNEKQGEGTLEKLFYSNDSELLQDYYNLINLLIKVSKDSKFDIKTEAPKKLEEMKSTITNRINNTLQNKTPLNFFKVAKKHKLDNIEMLIMAYYLLAEIEGDYGYKSDSRDLLCIISEGDFKAQIEYRKYFYFESKLRKDIIRMGSDSNKFIILPRITREIFGEKEPARKRMKEKKFKMLSIKKIYTKLEEFIIGQQHVKKVIAVAAHNHLKRITMGKLKKGKKQLSMSKSNILLTGPTGVGKTYICQVLSKILDVPFVMCDATSYTEAGYVGAKVEDIIKSLYNAAGKNIRLAEKGIVYIDEIDKISSKTIQSDHNSDRDVSGEGVQQDLLKLLEGKVVELSEEARLFRSEPIKIDTSNILFIAGGAFSGLYDKMQKDNRKIGFMNENDKQCEYLPQKKAAKKPGQSDIIKYGMLPEFIGRFPVLACLDKLTSNDMEKVITEPEDSILKQFQNIFNANGFHLKVEEDVIKWIAEQASNQSTGARAIRSIMEDLLTPIMYENSLEEKTSGEIIVDMEMVQKYCSEQIA